MEDGYRPVKRGGITRLDGNRILKIIRIKFSERISWKYRKFGILISNKMWVISMGMNGRGAKEHKRIASEDIVHREATTLNTLSVGLPMPSERRTGILVGNKMVGSTPFFSGYESDSVSGGNFRFPQTKKSP